MADTGAPGTGQEPSQGTQQGGQEPPASQSAENGQQQQGQPQEGGQQQQGQQASNDGMPDLSGITDPTLRTWVETQAAQAKEARDQAAKYRTERNSLREKVTQYERANETEQQRTEREAAEHQERVAALEAENRALKLGSQWNEAAQTAKALDPAALLALVGGADQIQMGEDGKATNLEALLAKAKTSYPWAFARAAAGGADAGDGGQGPASQGGMNDFIRNGGRAPRRA